MPGSSPSRLLPPRTREKQELHRDPSPGGNVAGYRIHVGRSPGRSPGSTDVGRATTYRLPATLAPGTYFFAIQAYGYQDDVSPLSEEIWATISPRSNASACPPGAGCGDACSSIDGSGSFSPSPDLCYPYRNPVGSLEGRLVVTNVGSEATQITWMYMEPELSSDASSSWVRALRTWRAVYACQECVDFPVGLGGSGQPITAYHRITYGF